MENLKEKLEKEVEKTKWPLLEEHHKRGALLMLDLDLNLVEVGVAIAQDDILSVKEWLTTKKITHPTQEKILVWEENPELDFNFLIIQPYVIAQEVKD